MKTKITFLVLHLGYGGIETSTINTANALCNKYEIEIISFYNLKQNQEKKLKNCIKVTHLYDGEPNREIFMKYLHEKRLIKVIKEGFKSIHILYLRKSLIKKAIKNSDSRIIISTRYDFSTLLSKYKPNNITAIAQEHHHHNNDKKYLNILKSKYENIDYLFALTEGLEKDYQKIVNKNIKIVLMPNMLTYYPNKTSNCTTNNIIYVGRLHPGKKVDELVEIVSKIEEINKFYIIGDGNDYDKIKNLIKEKKLTDKIKLLGYKNTEEIAKYMIVSSVFVMTSISEGLPMVLLEAMSYGVPCVAYETESGIKDIIDNNKNGYIIKNRDENEFINKVKFLLNNNDILKEFSKDAIIKSHEFSEEKIVQKWDDLIKEIIKK